MSLQIWLPLNGNLNNQGLSEVTSTGGTVNDAGIFGKCYACTSSSYIAIQNTVTDKYDFSFSFWMKVPTTLSSVGAWNTMLSFRALNTNDNSTEASVGINWASYNNIKIYDDANHQDIWMAPGNQFNYDKWCHYTITHTGNDSSTTIKVYTDGILRGTFNNSHRLVLRSGNILLGSGINPSYGPIYFNDFRLYDHCLSAKEVKEISKGLICHYKLDNNGFGNPNILVTQNPSDFSRQGNKYTSKVADTRTNDHFQLQYFKGSTYITTFYSQDVSATPCNVKTTFTVPENASGVRVKFDGARRDIDLFSSSQAPVTPGETYTLSLRVLSSKSEVVGGIQVENPKLEKGSVATPWCPHTSDSLYTSLGLDSTTESDCSGYSYNGTLSESLPYASDSPRYDGCYYFNSTSKRITLPAISMSGFSNSFSISWWGKAPFYSGLMYWGFSDGNRLNYYSGMYCNTGDGSNNPYYKPNTTTTVSTPSVDTWHHFVMVGDGSSNKLYMDGELYGVAKSYKGITGSTIVINGWDSSTSYKTNGYISDFRIYSTALSASDIKELYNTAASVDKNGNVYTYEFKEE